MGRDHPTQPKLQRLFAPLTYAVVAVIGATIVALVVLQQHTRDMATADLRHDTQALVMHLRSQAVQAQQHLEKLHHTLEDALAEGFDPLPAVRDTLQADARLRAISYLDRRGVPLWAVPEFDEAGPGRTQVCELTSDLLHTLAQDDVGRICIDTQNRLVQIIKPIHLHGELVGVLLGDSSWPALMAQDYPAWISDEYNVAVGLASELQPAERQHAGELHGFITGSGEHLYLVAARKQPWAWPWQIVLLMVILLLLTAVLGYLTWSLRGDVDARMHAERRLRKKVKLDLALDRVGKLLLQDHPISDIAGTMLQTVNQLTEGDVGAVFAWDYADGEMRCLAVAPAALPGDREAQAVPLQSVVVQTWHDHELREFDVASAEPELRAFMRRNGVARMVAVPALNEGKVVGVLITGDGHGYRRRVDRVVLRRFASLLSMAVKRERYVGDLMASEARFRELFDRVTDAVYVHDMAGVIQHVNSAACNASGRSVDDLIGRNMAELFYSSDQDLNVTWHHGDRFGVASRDAWQLRADGTEFPVSIRTGQANFDTRPMGLSLVHDVTQARQQQEAVQAWGNRQAVVADLGISALSSATDYDVLETGTALLVHILGVHSGFVYLPGREAEEAWHLRAHFRRDTEFSPPLQLAAHRAAQLIEPMGKERSQFLDGDAGGVVRLPIAMSGHNFRSGFVTTIPLRDGRDGLLCLLGKHTNLTRDDLHFSTSVANVFASALYRSEWEQQLADQRRFLQEVIDGIPERIMVVRRDYTVDLVNHTSQVALPGDYHLQEGEKIKCHRALYGFDSPCREPDHPCPLEAMWTSGKPESVLHQHAETQRIYEVGAAPLFDHAGNIVAGIHSLRDVTEREQAQQQLRDSEQRMAHMAHHDSLTALPNRLYFAMRLEEEIAKARRKHTQLAVLFLDLDRFKQVNDTLGHEAGDAVLKAAAVRMSECVRRGDLVSRLGGDEFTVMLGEIAGGADAADVAAKIIERITKPVVIDGQQVQVGTSIGIALYPDDGGDVESLLQAADNAMYMAKQAGRGGYQFATDDLNRTAAVRQRLEYRLREALELHQFELLYQPVVAMADGSWQGVEALLRWHDPEHGLTTPAHFFPVAEASGLMVPIGEFVMRQASSDYRRWLDAGHAPLNWRVNLSLRQFRQNDLVEMIAAALAAARIAPEQFCIELTESTLSGQGVNDRQTLQALHELGVRLSVDDAGSWQLPYKILHRVEFSELKIDQALVARLGEESYADTLVQTLITFAQGLNLAVVAEGVESAIQCDRLRALGCTQAQGYHFMQPIGFEELCLRAPSGSAAAPASSAVSGT